jgi:cyclopropane fatty-acyl-phospholipid synthase-like methyltransferase
VDAVKPGDDGSNARRRYFADMYGANADPYGLRTRWYEKRKLALLLAALPDPRYACAYEPACGIGETTVALAARCDRLLSSDFSPEAVCIARERTRSHPQVRVAQHSLPAEWPQGEGPFDLVVLSELGYFMDADEWQQVARRCGDSLGAAGTLVACHWRIDFDQRRQSTDDVHASLSALGLPRILRHEEDDFLLELWSRDGRSVAQRDGIR